MNFEYGNFENGESDKGFELLADDLRGVKGKDLGRMFHEVEDDFLFVELMMTGKA
jgi:hypothetical protein